MIERIRLAEWARSFGSHPRTAYRVVEARSDAGARSRLPSGTIVVDAPVGDMSGRTVVYVRVPSHDQRPDPGEQAGRVRTWCARHALRVDEVGSGMIVRRLTLACLLRGPEVGTMLDRAARNLATLVGEVTGATSTPSCRGATVNQPDGNPRLTHTMWAAGTATGRPTRPTPRRKATATRTERTHIRSQFR
jgi:predicted site-specific integrase-resolvase